MNYLKNLKTKLDILDVYYVGCTQTEIETVEQELINPFKFPNCYIAFLLLCGKNMDRKPGNSRGYLVGNDVFIDDLKLNNNEEGLIGLLQEDESLLTLPEKAFVFYGHQGYIYAFFKLNEGDNPPVYGYEEGYEGASFPKIADSLSSFYERYIDSGWPGINKIKNHS